MAQFDECHKEAYGPECEVPKKDGGNPDAGNGWYSKQLPLKEWVTMAKS